jgi:hypothetical protein
MLATFSFFNDQQLSEVLEFEQIVTPQTIALL